MANNPIKHQRRSIRLKGYDYSQAGLYFITICTQNRACLFGNVVNDEMILNEYGHIAHNEWMKTPEIRTNVELCDFVIMPNHVHGIIRILRRGEMNSPKMNSPNTNMPEMPLNALSNELHSFDNGGVFNTPLRSPSQTIGSIVRGYKSSVTKQLGLLGFNGKIWQRNYHEHIIRDEQSYINISNYIIKNPANWNRDSLK